MDIPASLPPHKTPLIKVKQATFGRHGGPVFQNIDWELKSGETWAITGPMGSGKTTFAEAITAKIPIRSGNINYNLEAGAPLLSVHAQKQIAFLSFSPSTAKLNYRNYYYQQRYHSSESNGIVTVADFLNQTTNLNLDKFSELVQLWKLEELLPLEVIKLSNGQTRKMLLVRALLQDPKLLILDNPYAGLDVQSRQELDESITHLIQRDTLVLLITNPQTIPAFVTHVLQLQNFALHGIFSREKYIKEKQKAAATPPTTEPNKLASLFTGSINLPDFDIAIRFENTSIKYDNKQVLNEINWTIRKGEKWALTGPNGSGKTTLLSLINGDNPQAFANKITLFDRRKGTGESIWDIKKRIGFMSPELHLYFRENMLAETVVATGFTDTLYLNRKLTETERQIIADFFDYLHLEPLRQKSFLQLSSGEQRLVLLVRSLIKNPDLLIWDEPFQNLHPEYIAQATQLLQAYATPNKTIILVSHYSQEIPAWISNTLYLEEGRMKSITSV